MVLLHRGNLNPTQASPCTMMCFVRGRADNFGNLTTLPVTTRGPRRASDVSMALRLALSCSARCTCIHGDSITSRNTHELDQVKSGSNVSDGDPAHMARSIILARRARPSFLTVPYCSRTSFSGVEDRAHTNHTSGPSILLSLSSFSVCFGRKFYRP
jgi:hypothetical protein